MLVQFSDLTCSAEKIVARQENDVGKGLLTGRKALEMAL